MNDLYLMRLNLELASAGFASDRSRGLYQPPKPRPSRAGMRRADPDYERAYRLRLREKRLRYGLVKPRNDMERAIASEIAEKPMQKVGDGPLAMWVAA